MFYRLPNEGRPTCRPIVDPGDFPSYRHVSQLAYAVNFDLRISISFVVENEAIKTLLGLSYLSVSRM